MCHVDTLENQGKFTTQERIKMHGQKILDEVQEKLSDGKTGCIIFDLACYFPYDAELTFDFKLGLNELTDKKVNHRYYNKAYHTISRTYGRKISKIGYPYFFSLDEYKNDIMLLNVIVGGGRSGKISPLNLIFPIEIKLTKSKPICGLTMGYNYHKGVCKFSSHKRDKDLGWKTIYWTTLYDEDDEMEKDNEAITLINADVDRETNTVLFSDVITPCPDKPENLLVGF